jgi:hypothetical protein
MEVTWLENFSTSEMERAAQTTGLFDVVFLFSTKWQPPHPLLQSLPFGEALQERFFGYHEDVTPERAAEMLGGRIIHYENRNNQWVAIIAIERVEDAKRSFEFPVNGERFRGVAQVRAVLFGAILGSALARQSFRLAH